LAQTKSLKASSSGFRPKKRLGQHFLTDSKIIHEIIALSRFQPSDLILEIGPGLGALTLPLARSVSHVVAVEKDINLVHVLKKKLSRAGITNVTFVNRDILAFDIHEIRPSPSKKIKIIGNLPYNISSPFMERLAENRDLIGRAVLMFQLEFAKRIAASPGQKAYGALTLLIQYHAHPTVLLEVPKQAFYPKPRVDSMVLEIDFERPYPKQTQHEDYFRKVVKGAFYHRRKTILNSLKGSSPSWNRELLLDAMKTCHIDPGRRAETLNMSDFLCLTSALAFLCSFIDKNAEE
jgi:16S rRNA (adenine1518-N6/adenine1519-N6)-dimethyltransferase